MFIYDGLKKQVKDLSTFGTEIGEPGLSEKVESGSAVSLAVLGRACSILNCDVGDLVSWRNEERCDVNWDTVVAMSRKKDVSLNQLGVMCGKARSFMTAAKARGSKIERRTVGMMADILGCDWQELLKGYKQTEKRKTEKASGKESVLDGISGLYKGFPDDFPEE